ncbi:MFS transporter [Streptomyces sp. ET3-23]|uniref:MFS transporter n=1 Tax=Streptomyces sp. ET3-23 TaxID=2885643 RepID=UPI001D11D8A0|nr:MFS transporter [Streptomyces sp. ET3-23]MCC2280887.1 MFS transporter [Streptomyces sp. ET3-23]
MAIGVSKNVRHSVVVSLVGTTLVWYDFYLYVGASAVVFHHQFFPYLSPFAETLAAVGLYGAGLVARPVGGVLFGRLGDRRGRRPALVTTLLLTGTATGLIALLPSYAQAGLFAPLALVALRLLQGLGLGGAWGAAAVVAVECSEPERRGRAASWAQIGAPAGNLLAFAVVSAVSALLTPAQFVTWGWRLPFLVSALLVLVGLWARMRLEETPAFRALQASGLQARRPVAELWQEHRGRLLCVVAVTAGADVVLFTFSFSYVLTLLNAGGLSPSAMLVLAVLAPLALIGLIPFFGAVSDRYGRRRVCLAGTLATAAWAAVFFPLFMAGQLAMTMLACVLGMAAFAAMYAPQAALVAEAFPGRVRSSGATVGYQLGGLFGGTLAVFCTSWATHRFATIAAVPVYAFAALTVSAAALLASSRLVEGKPA